MNVLICDDDLKIVQQIKNFLLKLSKQSTYNFDITCFSNGDSILDKQIKTDFAFIDIEMPGVNGLSVTKHLQTLNPNIIVFIVTSFQGYLDDAMDLKVFRFLSKPIDENRFFRSMEIALNLYKQSTEKIILDYFDECHNIFHLARRPYRRDAGRAQTDRQIHDPGWQRRRFDVPRVPYGLPACRACRVACR